jgi:hypothetical protein
VCVFLTLGFLWKVQFFFGYGNCIVLELEHCRTGTWESTSSTRRTSLDVPSSAVPAADVVCQLSGQGAGEGERWEEQ